MITSLSTFVNDIVIDYGHRNGPRVGPLDGVWGPYVDDRRGAVSCPLNGPGAVRGQTGDRGGGVVGDPDVSPRTGDGVAIAPPKAGVSGYCPGPSVIIADSGRPIVGGGVCHPRLEKGGLLRHPAKGMKKRDSGDGNA